MVVYAEGNDFRNVKWGMTQDEVIQAEELKSPSKKSDSLNYTINNMYNYRTTLIYNFDSNGVLNNALYNFFNPLANGKDATSLLFGTNSARDLDETAVDLYNQLKNDLTQKYGAPAEDTINWKNESYKNSSESLGKRVSRGYVSFYATWVLDRTVIKLTCDRNTRYGSWCANTRLNYYEKSFYESLNQKAEQPSSDSKNL
jgi:hypothetical protein